MEQKLKEKLRKLQSIIEDPGASEGEVYNASTLMSKLLKKHNLDHSALDLSFTDVIDTGVSTTVNKNDGRYELALAKLISENNLGEAYFSPGGEHSNIGTIHFLGTPENVEAMISQFKIITQKFKFMSKQRVKEAKRKAQGKFNPNKWKRDYTMGLVAGLRDKYEALKRDLGTESGEYGLMVTKHNAIIEAYKEEKLNLTSRRARRVRVGEGYAQGKMDGNRVTHQNVLNN